MAAMRNDQMGKITVFDKIINELTINDNGREQLDQCMQFNYKLSRKVPLRYKIISIGFVRKYTVEEVNAKLQEYGLARLYARNLWEASLLFAFGNSLSYEKWRELSMSVQAIRESLRIDDNVLNRSNISMKILKEYIEKAHCKTYVLGISGGVDSSLCAALARNAVGKDRLLCLILPIESHKADEEDALLLAKELDLNYEIVENYFVIEIK